MKPRFATAARRHGRSWSRRIAGTVAATLILVAGPAAHAQQAIGPPAQPALLPPAPLGSNVEVSATPYLWFPWVSLRIRPSDTRIPTASETIGPGTLYDQLTWLPFMGTAEFRTGPYGLVLDYMHVPLRAGIGTRDILFSGATSGLTMDIGTALLLYRPLVDPIQYVDVGLGVRAWGLAGDITLNEGLLPAVSVSNGLSWADPLVAVRYHRELGNGFSATASGDVGGFGLGAHIDWQLVGTIDYAVNSWIDAHAGFRSLNFNYGAPHADFKFSGNGPIIGVTFRF